MFKRLCLLLILSFFALSCAEKDNLLIVVSDNLEVSGSIKKSMPRNCEVLIRTADQLTDLKSCKLLWIHDLDDPTIFDSSSIIEYVKRGGNLVLTSKAVLQLNNWGLEPETIVELNHTDDFSQVPFYSHPVFADVEFKSQLSQFSKRDFSIFGFADSAKPQMKDAAVIAVAYDQGEVLVNSKTMWEMPLIHGKILAAGAGFPFGESWADMKYLKKISSGVVTYLIDETRNSSEKKSYAGVWNCDTLLVSGVHAGHHIDCKICAAEYKPVKPQKPEMIHIPDGTRKHLAEADAFIEVSEGNMSLKAAETGGIAELWIDDVRIVTDYRPLADIQDIDSVVIFSHHIPYVEMHKRGFTRRYDIDGVELTESLVLYPEHSSVVIHYQWEDQRVRQMFTEHKADLAFGYPYNATMMSLYYVWSLQLNATVVRSEDKNYCSIVGSNVPGRMTLCGRYSDITYKDWKVRGTRTDNLQVESSVVYRVKGLNSMDVVISGTAKGVEHLQFDYAYTLGTPKDALTVGLK